MPAVRGHLPRTKGWTGRAAGLATRPKGSWAAEGEACIPRASATQSEVILKSPGVRLLGLICKSDECSELKPFQKYIRKDGVVLNP